MLSVRYAPVAYADPFVNAERQRIRLEALELAALAREHFGTGSQGARKRPSRIDISAPATAEFIRRAPAMRHWLRTVPTVSALHPLYAPSDRALPGGAHRC